MSITKKDQEYKPLKDCVGLSGLCKIVTDLNNVTRNENDEIIMENVDPIIIKDFDNVIDKINEAETEKYNNQKPIDLLDTVLLNVKMLQIMIEKIDAIEEYLKNKENKC